jgi:hypothetical protein
MGELPVRKGPEAAKGKKREIQKYSAERKLDLWRAVASTGYLAEVMLIENAHATAGLKECWSTDCKF